MTNAKSADRSKTADFAGFQQNGSQSCENPAEFTIVPARKYTTVYRDSRIPCRL